LKTYLTCRFALAVILLFCLNLSAQERSNYSLLWKIEGENQKKPSYLFGTMHVNDARAFHFSDAVLPAIKSCEKFALEVQPDSIAIKMSNNPNSQKAYLTYKKILSADEFKEISDRFFLVNGYNIEESTSCNPNVLVSMLHPETNKDDDKTTFVDMHLLGHAKTMQKEIVGLENIEDQLNVFEKLSLKEQRKFILQEVTSNINNYQEQLEALTKIYLTGDINEIDKMVDSYGGYDKELESRNNVMCKSIIEQMENSSIFSAVGAAHLPGNIGLIKLLKDRGYKVTAVEANFTGVANTFKIDPLKMKWKTFSDPKMGYSLETPGTVGIDSSYADFKLNSYPDLISKKYYTFFTIDLRHQLTAGNEEAFYEKIISNTSTKYDAKIISRKEISKPNTTGSGYEVVMKLNTIETDSPFTGIRSIYLINKGIFYQFFVLDAIEDIENGSIDRFFNSIKFSEPEPEEEKKWISYYSEEGAFSVNLPEYPRDSSKTLDNPYEENGEPHKLNLFISTDLVNGNNYLFRYNDLPTGYHIDNLEESFDLMEKSLLSKASKIISTKTTKLDGYEGRVYEIILKDDFHAICKVFLRGNRTYLLLSQKLKKDEKTDPNNAFFKSFKFEKFKTQDKQVKHIVDGFEFNTLEKNRVIIDSLDYSESYFENSSGYFSKNTKNGDCYSFEFSKLKPYFKINSTDDFYGINKDNLLNWDDSIITERTFKLGNVNALEVYKINKKDSLRSRFVLWLDANYFFLTSAFTTKETINSTLTNSILRSYKSIKKRKSINYFTSKVDRVISDLKSNDSIVFNDALGALSYYDFEKTDLRYLYKTGNLEYATSENKKLGTEAILNVLRETNDAKTLNFLKTLYLKGDLSENAKRTILYTIPNLENDNRLDEYANLLFNYTPKESNTHDYGLFYPFKDSLKFAIQNYKPLTKLRHQKEFRINILEISSKILQSNYQNSMYILSHLDQVNEYAREDLEAYLNMLEEDEYDYTQHSLINNYLSLYYNIPDTTNDEFIDDFTQELTSENANNWLTFQALKVRLKHNLEINSSTKKLYLDSLDTRFPLIKAYHQANKLKAVSSTYLRPEKFSKLSLNEFLNYNDESPKNTRLLKKITKNDQQYYVYAMDYQKSNSDNETDSYLAIVGPCKKIKQEDHTFKTYSVHTNWELVEDDWQTQATDLIPQLNRIASD